MTEDEIRAWLLAYAWDGTDEEKAANVECIIDQGEWKHLSARVEQFAGMAVDERQATEAEGYALSALYECHEGPHIHECPMASPDPS